jgi:hypothetical protein
MMNAGTIWPMVRSPAHSTGELVHLDFGTMLVGDRIELSGNPFAQLNVGAIVLPRRLRTL